MIATCFVWVVHSSYIIFIQSLNFLYTHDFTYPLFHLIDFGRRPKSINGDSFCICLRAKAFVNETFLESFVSIFVNKKIKSKTLGQAAEPIQGAAATSTVPPVSPQCRSTIVPAVAAWRAHLSTGRQIYHAAAGRGREEHHCDQIRLHCGQKHRHHDQIHRHHRRAWLASIVGEDHDSGGSLTGSDHHGATRVKNCKQHKSHYWKGF